MLSCLLCVSLGELTQGQLELLHRIHWLPLAGFLTLSAQLPNQEAFFVSDRKPLVFLWCWDQMQGLGLASPGELTFAFLLDAGYGRGYIWSDRPPQGQSPRPGCQCTQVEQASEPEQRSGHGRPLHSSVSRSFSCQPPRWEFLGPKELDCADVAFIIL